MSGTDASPALCARAAAGGAGAGRQAAPFASPRANAGKATPCGSSVRFRLQRGALMLCDSFVLARLIAYSPRCGFPEGGAVTHRGQKQYLVILGSSWVTSYSFHRVVAGRLLASAFLWPPNPQESRESPAECSYVCVEGEL